MQNNSITAMAGTEMLVPTTTVGIQPTVNTPTPMGIGGGTPVSLFATANSNASSADPSPVTGGGQVVNTKSSANKQQNNNNNNAANSGVAGGMCDEKTVEYLRDLIAEKRTIENNNINTSGDPENCTMASAKSIVLRLLEQGKDVTIVYQGIVNTVSVSTIFKITCLLLFLVVPLCYWN